MQRMMSNGVERSNDFITTLIDIIRHRSVLHDYVAYKEIKQNGALLVMTYDVAMSCCVVAEYCLLFALPPPHSNHTSLLFTGS